MQTHQLSKKAKTRMLIALLTLCQVMMLVDASGTNNESSTTTSLSINNNIQASDNNLVLQIVEQDSKRILQVSFNGDEGQEGTLKIFDSTHNLAIESNFELIKTPFYSSVDITSLKSGIYNVELTTKKGVHNSSITVK